MDLPPYHHHHHQRYVPRPTNFPHNPNFFHHLPPPPPPQQRPPPPPPPISNLPPPPPPPHHHITHPSLLPPSFHHKSQFPFPSRFSENPRFSDFPQNRSPPRVSSNHPPYHPHHPHPQNLTYHNPPPPPTPSQRFIVDDFSSSRANDNQQPHWVRRDVEIKYDDDERYRLERRRMVNIDVNPPSDSRELRDDRYERERWEYDGTVDEVSVGSSSRRVSSLDNNGNGNDYGDVRFSNRLRVDTEEIHRSPQEEQVQKKSALLRIQCGKPNNRSRNQGSELSSGGLRAKQKDVFERLERKVEGRGEGSQMELDVSFKSNALVAKAIMTPSSSAIDSDRSEIPRGKKIRKVSSSGPSIKRIGNDLGKGDGLANDSGCQSSSKKKSPSKSSKRQSLSKSSNKESSSKSSNKESICLTDKITVSAGGSSSDCTSDSNKDSRHLADKIANSGGERASRGTLNSNKESKRLSDEVTVSVVSSASNSTSLPSSNGTNDLIGVKESMGSPKATVLDQGSDHVEKFRIPLFIVRKKKKVTNKKVTTPIKAGVNPGNAIHPCRQGENVVELVERTRTDDMTTLEDVNVKLPSDEVVSKLEKPSELAAVSKDESVEPSNSDGKKASPAKVLVSSSMDSGSNEVADYTSRSVHNGPFTLNETCMTEVQEERTNFDADNTVNVGGYSEDELRVSKDGPAKESSEAMVCVERSDDVVLSSIDGRKIHKDEVSLSVTDTHISADSELGFSDGKKNAVAAIGSFEAGFVEPSSDRDIVPLLTNIEKGLQERFLNGNNSSCNSDETGGIAVVNDLQTAECSSNSYPRSGTFGGSFESCVDGVTLSSETNHTNGSVNAVVSVGDDIRTVVDNDCLSKVTKKRKIMDDESALATTKISKTGVNEVSFLLGPGKNFSLSREDDASGEEDVTVSGNGTDSLKGDCSHGGPSEVELSFQGCFEDCPNSCSTKCPKKREVSSPAKAECVPSVTTNEGPSSWRITVPLVNDVSVAELESQNTLSNVNDGPLAHPSVIMLESSSIAKDVCQAEPFEDGLVDQFSDVQQVIANNSQLGAVGQETTTSDVPVEMERMAYTVSEDKGSSLGIDKKLASKGGESCSYVLDRYDMPLLAENLSLVADKVRVESMESVPDTLHNSSVSEVPNDKSSMSSEIIIEKAQSIDETCVAAYDHASSSVKTSLDTFEFGRSSDHKVGGSLLVNVNTVPLSSQNPVKSTKNVNSQSLKPNQGVSQQSPAGLRVSSVRPSSFITSRNVPAAKKPLTWHRTGSSSSSVDGRYSHMNFLPPQSHLTKDITKINSYIRKGNSLVRNPPPVGSLSKGYHAPSASVYRLNSSGVNDLKKKSEIRAERTGSPSCRGSPEVNAPSERPKTPPQSEPFSCITLKSTSLPVVDHPGNGSIATNSDPLEAADDILTSKASEHPLTSSTVLECQVDLRGNSESQNILDEGSSRKSIVYVKQRSNQLVAASDKTQTSSDGYYKRRTNQLIRASSNIHMKERVATSKNIVPFQRGLAKTSKLSKFSLVWKLGDTQSSRKYGGTVEYEKLWPALFPWKRVSYWRSSLRCSPSNSSSIIRRKLLLSKKRETIYTRSNHGLSLRRSKVLSVSGSSLKWSKSLEQRSKKVAEDAALTVAAVYKRKRGQDGFNAGSMNGNNVSRERIFRIGCERYKMDPSGKTLQRISGDEEPSVSVPEVKKSYIPKRLLIGNDEYVRVGNGNKLVRNPKRRVRILANEKVRWSLHTARIRLARKKQYCQFFTRFGKCNKDNGKCPYIHDPSKIAVCTKFLNGSCSDTNCKLTHEVIPERMQDCSYFLQGMCSNENCPYRHVNVNSNASVCEGFLRGYCADGNECRKKHTYVCPVFEATGNCPQGSKCKLHHPKNKRKGVKRKACSEMKNVRGRYFGSPHIDTSDCITAGPEKPSVKGNDDIFGKEGEFLDFISLGDSDEEEQTIDQRSEETPLCESVPAEMQLDDLDERIKPMRLINRDRSVGSSPFIDSPSNI